jgi:hypothetical protein
LSAPRLSFPLRKVSPEMFRSMVPKTPENFHSKHQKIIFKTQSLLMQWKPKQRTLFVSVCLLAFLSFFAVSSCKKGKSNPNPPATEEKLVVTTNPATDGHVEAPAPGPDFQLSVTITSKMPAGGVKIDVSSKKDGSTDAPIFTTTRNTSTATNTFTITGTPSGNTYVVTVTVTSLSQSSNTFTGTYKYSRK